MKISKLEKEIATLKTELKSATDPETINKLEIDIVNKITQRLNEQLSDITTESPCKEHENPDSCYTEYKNKLRAITMHQYANSLGFRHNFSEGATAPSVMDHPSQTSSSISVNQFCKIYFSEKLEECLSVFNNQDNPSKSSSSEEEDNPTRNLDAPVKPTSRSGGE